MRGKSTWVRELKVVDAQSLCGSLWSIGTLHQSFGAYARVLYPALSTGGFDSEEQAALAYDIAAIKCRGREVHSFVMDKALLHAHALPLLPLSCRRRPTFKS